MTVALDPCESTGYGVVAQDARRPYIVQDATETGAFALDLLFAAFLDRNWSATTSLDLIGSYRALANKRPCFGNSGLIGGCRRNTGLRLLPSQPDPNAKFSFRSIEAESDSDRSDGCLLVEFSPLIAPEIEPGNELDQPADRTLETGYDVILKEIHSGGIWSWRDLSTFLGPSHTELRRVANGKSVASEMGARLDEFYDFYLSVVRATRGNRVALQRALSTIRTRDGLNAFDHLRAKNYRSAFQAVMDAVSPRIALPGVVKRALLWHDSPSRDIYDRDEAESND